MRTPQFYSYPKTVLPRPFGTAFANTAFIVLSSRVRFLLLLSYFFAQPFVRKKSCLFVPITLYYKPKTTQYVFCRYFVEQRVKIFSPFASHICIYAKREGILGLTYSSARLSSYSFSSSIDHRTDLDQIYRSFSWIWGYLSFDLAPKCTFFAWP